MTRKLEAILWDMDGTLVDSEPAWFEAQAKIVNQHGGRWTRTDAAALLGADMDSTVSAMQAAGADLASEEIARMLTTEVVAAMEGSLSWRPGAIELVTELATSRIPQAIVTTSSRAMTQPVVDALPAGSIHLAVTSDDVTNSKPHPEPYLKAAAQLGCDIRRCIVIEDSLVGLTAGLASGAQVIGVPHDIDLPDPHGWTRWPSLRERSVVELEALLPA